MPIEHLECLVVRQSARDGDGTILKILSTLAEAPYCHKFTTGIFSAFACESTSGRAQAVIPTPLDGYSTLDFSSTSDNGASSPTISISSPAGGVNNLNNHGSATAFTQTQQTGNAADNPSIAPTTTSDGSRSRHVSKQVALYVFCALAVAIQVV
jgi:hypothetical protein